jgi:hypothetical protein
VLHLEFADAIYRVGAGGEALYPTEESLMAPISPFEAHLVAKVAERLRSACPAGSRVYSPLAIGGHVDHRLTRAAAERLGRPLWYYRDFPYALREPSFPAELPPPPGRETFQTLSSEEIQTWAAAVSEYRSQLSTFWPDDYALYQEIREFHDRAGGVMLLAPGDVSQAA